MKRYIHYSGDPTVIIPLPQNCRWIRVSDFDALGIIGTTLLNRSVGTGGNYFNLPGNIPSRENAELKINNSSIVPVESRSLVILPRYPRVALEHVEIFGNVEIEVSEGEPFTGPLHLRDHVDLPVRLRAVPVDVDPQNGLPTFILPVPKGTRAFWFALRANGGVINNLQILPATLEQASANNPSPNGTVWRPNRKPITAALAVSTADAYAIGPGNSPGSPLITKNALAAQNVSVHLSADGITADDAPNNVYFRPWAPSPALKFIITTTGSVDLTGHMSGLSE